MAVFSLFLHMVIFLGVHMSVVSLSLCPNFLSYKSTTHGTSIHIKPSYELNHIFEDLQTWLHFEGLIVKTSIYKFLVTYSACNTPPSGYSKFLSFPQEKYIHPHSNSRKVLMQSNINSKSKILFKYHLNQVWVILKYDSS